MPVLDAVQTFAGIANENEFYSHHYLAEVFRGDIKSRLEGWDAAAAAAAAAAASEAEHRIPPKALAAFAQHWFALRRQRGRTRDLHEKWALFTQAQAGLLAALGYSAPNATPIPLSELVPGSPLPIWQLVGATRTASSMGAATTLEQRRHGTRHSPFARTSWTFQKRSTVMNSTRSSWHRASLTATATVRRGAPGAAWYCRVPSGTRSGRCSRNTASAGSTSADEARSSI